MGNSVSLISIKLLFRGMQEKTAVYEAIARRMGNSQFLRLKRNEEQ
jgi:hypothetical protein